MLGMCSLWVGTKYWQSRSGPFRKACRDARPIVGRLKIKLHFRPLGSSHTMEEGVARGVESLEEGIGTGAFHYPGAFEFVAHFTS